MQIAYEQNVCKWGFPTSLAGTWILVLIVALSERRNQLKIASIRLVQARSRSCNSPSRAKPSPLARTSLRAIHGRASRLRDMALINYETGSMLQELVREMCTPMFPRVPQPRDRRRHLTGSYLSTDTAPACAL
jgi:hypothetical protein